MVGTHSTLSPYATSAYSSCLPPLFFNRNDQHNLPQALRQLARDPALARGAAHFVLHDFTSYCDLAHMYYPVGSELCQSETLPQIQHFHHEGLTQTLHTWYLLLHGLQEKVLDMGFVR